MPSCNAPLVSIIIPVHNQSEYTRACLASIAACPPLVEYEVVVVDDGSTDGTAQLLADICGKDNHVRSIRNAASLAFAGACNRGAKAALGSIILFLNNDTQVQPGWFPPLLEALANCPDIGIVAPKLIFTNRTIQHCGKVWSDPALPNSHPHHIYYKFPADHPAVTKSRDFQLVTGACIMVRASEFRELGGFDEGYENGWEDDDLCYKYTSSGKRIFYCAESIVIHHQNKTLNERMYELERRLPPHAKLRELDNCLVKGLVTEEDVSLARHVQETFKAMETELLRFREKFHKNRNRFFLKWGAMIRRDDYLYCKSDNVPLGEALKDIASPHSPAPTSIPAAGASQGTEEFPLVSIVILTFNRLDVTKECIASIRRHTPEPHELIFVDNGSTDGTVEWLRELAADQSNARLVANGTNLGFSKGCNQGIENSRGDYILLLNNDTVVTPGWLTGLLECFAGEEVGIVGPMTDNISGIQQWPWSCYQGRENLDRFAREFRDRYRYRRIPTRRIVGFCMLFRRELVNKIGLLDEQFGSGNFEDDDYCLRSAIEGYTNLIAGDVFIHHVGSASFLGNRIDYGEALLSNQSLFNRKWSKPITDEVTAKKIIRLKTLEKAEQLYRRGDTNESVETLLQEGIRQIPDEPRLYKRLAEIFLSAGMPKDALDILLECPVQDNRTSVISVEAHLAMGNTAEARREMAKIHPSAKETPELLALSGDVLLASGELLAAGEAFERALSGDAGSVKAYTGLASLAVAAGDRELALALLERAASIAPTGGGPISEYCVLCADMGDSARAEQVLAEARHFYPDDAQLAYFHIDVLLKQEKYEPALAVIEQALVQFKTGEGFLDAASAVRSRIGPLMVAQDRFKQGVAVSLCMIVRDEEKNLARCLASLRPIVDEIIIVDTGSTDRTREIAEVFGGVVLDVPWTGDYSMARNVSLDAAHGNWILVMDADEVISTRDHDRFRALIAESAGKQVAYTIVTRNYTNKVDLENWQANRGEYPHEEAGRGWMPSDKVRLFLNSPEIRFENPVHEMVEPSLVRLGIPDHRAEIVVHHYGYLDEARQQQKKEFYYELGKKKLAESNGSPVAICELAIQAAGIGRYDEAIELWHRALAFDPQSYLAHFNLGYAYLQKGKFKEASDASRKAMELRTNYREAVVNYSISELCLGHGASVMRTVSDAIQENVDYPTLQLMRGVINAAEGREGAAVKDFMALRDANVEFSQFIHETTVKLMQAGQYVLANQLVQVADVGGYCTPGTGRLLNMAGIKKSP